MECLYFTKCDRIIVIKRNSSASKQKVFTMKTIEHIIQIGDAFPGALVSNLFRTRLFQVLIGEIL